MSIQKQVTDEQTTIKIVGDFSIYEAAEAKMLLLDNSEGLDNKVLLDLEQVEQLDCAGVQLLLMLSREIQRLGGEIERVAMSDSVDEICHFLNLSPPFTEEEVA